MTVGISFTLIEKKEQGCKEYTFYETKKAAMILFITASF